MSEVKMLEVKVYNKQGLLLHDILEEKEAIKYIENVKTQFEVENIETKDVTEEFVKRQLENLRAASYPTYQEFASAYYSYMRGNPDKLIKWYQTCYNVKKLNGGEPGSLNLPLIKKFLVTELTLIARIAIISGLVYHFLNVYQS